MELIDIEPQDLIERLQEKSTADSKLTVEQLTALREVALRRCAYLAEEELHLTPIEYKLLCLLARNTGKVLTHKYILQNVWGNSLESDVGSLRVFMATLRKKLEKEPASPQYIQTHIGVGCRMMKVE